MRVTREICHICGNLVDFNIGEDATLLREAKCSCCGASIRNSDVAQQILKYIKCEKASLKESFRELSSIEILNTCASGAIHNILKNHDRYTCSEFFDGIMPGDYFEGIINVDLTNIPFKNNTFDIVISEDVFEHIENYSKAFLEIYRVLKPGGVHIFTVPIHEAHLTESRVGKKTVYHGNPNPQNGEKGSLVITDWGNDIQKIVSQYGFDVCMEMLHRFYAPEEITNVDDDYQTYWKYRSDLEKYQKYNSIVITATKKRSEVSDDIINIAYEDNKKEIRKYNRIIREKNEIIHSLNNENERRGQHILALDEKINNAGTEIDRLNAHIEKLSHWGQSLETDNQKLGKEVNRLNSHTANLSRWGRNLDAAKQKLELENNTLKTELNNKNEIGRAHV